MHVCLVHRQVMTGGRDVVLDGALEYEDDAGGDGSSPMISSTAATLAGSSAAHNKMMSFFMIGFPCVL